MASFIAGTRTGIISNADFEGGLIGSDGAVLMHSVYDEVLRIRFNNTVIIPIIVVLPPPVYPILPSVYYDMMDWAVKIKALNVTIFALAGPNLVNVDICNANLTGPVGLMWYDSHGNGVSSPLVSWITDFVRSDVVGKRDCIDFWGDNHKIYSAYDNSTFTPSGYYYDATGNNYARNNVAILKPNPGAQTALTVARTSAFLNAYSNAIYPYSPGRDEVLVAVYEQSAYSKIASGEFLDSTSTVSGFVPPSRCSAAAYMPQFTTPTPSPPSPTPPSESAPTPPYEDAPIPLI
eukprot:TRINITY_DN279_c0_g1_i2.p1 TRINITY_DN279_c0_g1~~TRINITY_DN279_c0_g1_i2.p1  ORF type:complete len:329 (-),score=53.63 TRINITY_DN279_c0_g1_i2:427-1299(-)